MLFNHVIVLVVNCLLYVDQPLLHRYLHCHHCVVLRHVLDSSTQQPVDEPDLCLQKKLNRNETYHIVICDQVVFFVDQLQDPNDFPHTGFNLRRAK